MEDEQEYDEIELHYDSLGEFYDDLDNLRLDEINFHLGFSRYDSDYHQYGTGKVASYKCYNQ
jgi:hypothetical protein